MTTTSSFQIYWLTFEPCKKVTKKLVEKVRKYGFSLVWGREFMKRYNSREEMEKDVETIRTVYNILKENVGTWEGAVITDYQLSKMESNEFSRSIAYQTDKQRNLWWNLVLGDDHKNVSADEDTPEEIEKAKNSFYCIEVGEFVSHIDTESLINEFKSKGYNVTEEALRFNFEGWKKSGCKSYYADEKNGYCLYSPARPNPLRFWAEPLANMPYQYTHLA